MSRAMVGKVPGLDWAQTYVLKAAGDEAMYLWERRFTLSQVQGRLARSTRISRRQVEDALTPLARCGYLYADDAPGNSEILLHLTDKGLDQYCAQFVSGYGAVTHEILSCVCQDQGADVHELARRTGRPALLIEHILDVAHGMALLRVSKQGQYIRVAEVRPQLRRLISGAA